MSDHDRLAHCFMPHGPDGQWQLASGNCCHTETGWICGRPEAEHPPKPSDPSDRDRLAAIVKERLDASNVADQRWRTSMSGSIANALTAAKALIARELVHMVHVSDRDRLAALFRLHRFIPGRQGVLAECGCGAIEDLAVKDWHEHHCADAFLAVGVTMPEPEPEEC